MPYFSPAKKAEKVGGGTSGTTGTRFSNIV
jgi:hypothetical protein